MQNIHLQTKDSLNQCELTKLVTISFPNYRPLKSRIKLPVKLTKHVAMFESNITRQNCDRHC